MPAVTGVTHERTTTPVDHDAALLADADPAVEAARRAAGAVAQARRPASSSAAPRLWPAGAVQRAAVDDQLDHEAASSTGAKRSGENQPIGTGDGAPVCQAATSSPVAGARPMPAPSWPVATQMFGASRTGR